MVVSPSQGPVEPHITTEASEGDIEGPPSTFIQTQCSSDQIDAGTEPFHQDSGGCVNGLSDFFNGADATPHFFAPELDEDSGLLVSFDHLGGDGGSYDHDFGTSTIQLPALFLQEQGWASPDEIAQFLIPNYLPHQSQDTRLMPDYSFTNGIPQELDDPPLKLSESFKPSSTEASFSGSGNRAILPKPQCAGNILLTLVKQPQVKSQEAAPLWTFAVRKEILQFERLETTSNQRT
ncbi:hypothetical protein PG993_006823 [Apiospora rasikravindrae]|uniref:Uncharacterized protein n=1 Tax=Apiospora rasikravindrae TaxID=990691 RepID=A0ABR1T6T1_9PEZI